MGDYDKLLNDTDRAAIAHLSIYHPDLLNPKYFEIYGEEEEE